MSGKLTDTKIKNIKHKDKDFVLTDGAGLQINIRANKTKRWELIFKSPTTFKRRKYPLGNYPTVSLKEARELKEKNINLIRKGLDPIDEKRKSEKEKKLNDESNFKVIADEWLEFEAKRTTPQTHRRKKAILVNDAYPLLEKNLSMK